MGKEAKLLARLILLRVPQEMVEQRRARIQAEAIQAGQCTSGVASPMDGAHYQCGAREALSEVLVMQRDRWQIERLFRLWKQDGKIDEWHGRTRWRILCEVVAKALAMLVQHWLLLMGTWDDPFRSLVKAAKQVRGHALELLSALGAKESGSGWCTG